MSKLNSTNAVPPEYKRADIISILSKVDTQVNAISEGLISGTYNASTAIPSGSVAPGTQGDKRWKSNLTVQGSAGAQYVNLGWACVASGVPGTWVEMRVLTGT